MLIRLPLAFVVGLVINMIAMAMTVYDGALSLIFQPIVGTIFTVVALAVLSIRGAPLLYKPVWQRWQHFWWISVLLFGLGLMSLAASWHPSLRVQMWDAQTSGVVDSFQPALGVGGWLAVMFSIVY